MKKRRGPNIERNSLSIVIVSISAVSWRRELLRARLLRPDGPQDSAHLEVVPPTSQSEIGHSAAPTKNARTGYTIARGQDVDVLWASEGSKEVQHMSHCQPPNSDE